MKSLNFFLHSDQLSSYNEKKRFSTVPGKRFALGSVKNAFFIQMIFRDNIQPMIRGKHVLVPMASVTTGFTAKRSLEAIGYCGGEVAKFPVHSVNDLPDYESYDYRECPCCKAGKRSMRWSTALAIQRFNP